MFNGHISDHVMMPCDVSQLPGFKKKNVHGFIKSYRYVSLSCREMFQTGLLMPDEFDVKTSPRMH